jgi:hypothetical protein
VPGVNTGLALSAFSKESMAQLVLVSVAAISGFEEGVLQPASITMNKATDSMLPAFRIIFIIIGFC